MKKIFFFTAIAFLMLSSSCKKEVTPLSKDRTATERVSSSGGAFPFHESSKFNLAGEQFYNSCTNELMTASTWGVHIEFFGMYNGNNSKATVHVNNYDIKLVGESGMEYIGTFAANYQESYFSNGVFTTKLVRNVGATTAGGGNNLIIRETFYIKVYADGTITYIRDPVTEIRCQ